MLIRYEKPEDQLAIRSVNESAFETSEEGNLVDRLREQADPIISLVAEDDGKIIGHIMFSPVSLSGHTNLHIMGLAPMAVLPERQGEGIGSALVKAGLEACKNLEYGAVIVLGHSTYYPRFGFKPAQSFGIKSEYDVPDDVFMALQLQPAYLEGVGGTICYHPAFSGSG